MLLGGNIITRYNNKTYRIDEITWNMKVIDEYKYKTGGGKIPIPPYGKFGKLVVQHYHDQCHKMVDNLVMPMRQDVWVIKARKLSKGIIKSLCRAMGNTVFNLNKMFTLIAETSNLVNE